ncbi:unnamed protein product [Effrenium voratum]|nr:unnamed protein product [Effrenium voratum]
MSKVNEILAEELSPELWKKWAILCLPPWTKAVPNPTQGIMHTFFQPTLAVERSGTGTLEAWRDLWQAAGFQVRVLTLEDAKAAPDFEEFSRRVRNNVPLGRNPEYEYFCYARYVAMAQVGGG